ncbi:sodium:proton antiporter, partial [candidate division MSBL1 archaeon SCGC-AAA259I07]
ANDESEPILGILVYEDLFIAFYIAFVSTLLLEKGSLANIMSSILLSAVFIAVLLFLVYRGGGFFQNILKIDSDDMLVLRVVGVTVLIAGVALSAGVSEAVAAFFVGMVFSDSDYAEDIERLLEPVRYVFAAIFFFWIGLVTDPALFVKIIPLLIVAVLITGVVKFFTAYQGARFYDLNVRRSTRVGLGLITRGEFSLIIGALAAAGVGALATNTVTQTIPAFAVSYVLVMSILGTTLMQYSEYFERIAMKSDNQSP